MTCENDVTELKQCSDSDKIPYGMAVNANLLTLEEEYLPLVSLKTQKALPIYICRTWYHKDLHKGLLHLLSTFHGFKLDDLK